MVRSRIFALITVLAAIGTSVFAQAPTTDSAKGYVVGPGDEITGKVLGEAQFDFVSTVDENGHIEVPFFDKPVNARCRTESELRTEVTKLLAKYLKNPQLSLRVTKRDSRPPVSLFGEVKEQQKFQLTRRVQLLELISYAGGESEKSGGVVQVFRTLGPVCSTPDDPNRWTASNEASTNVPMRQFSLTELRKGNQQANPEILAGDIIVVQKASPVYVIGEVMRPGEFVLPDGGLPLTQAIAMAAGVNREAKTKSVKVYRQKAGAPEPEVLAINYDEIRKGLQKDIMLQPMDIVEVGKAPKKFIDYVLEFATGLPNRIPIRPI
ncbi:MAG: SLBB domain-containing protein [Pyrinomonadaceae bacterium]